jgi:hypothetical protein
LVSCLLVLVNTVYAAAADKVTRRTKFIRRTSGWLGRYCCSEDSKCIYANPLTPETGGPLRLFGSVFLPWFPRFGDGRGLDFGGKGTPKFLPND